MWRIALDLTFARKRRLVGTALSVVIGVAFLTGTLVFTDTIRKTFDDVFAQVYDDMDVVVRSAEEIDTGFGGTVRGRIDESVVPIVAAVPGVLDAEGYIEGFARIIAADGDPLGSDQGAPQFGQSVIRSDASPWDLETGRLPEADGEVAIDAGSFSKGDFALGDAVTIVSQGGSRSFTLVGTVRFGQVDAPGGATFALFTLPDAQDFVGRAGQIDQVLVRSEGATEAELAAQIQTSLPEGVEAITRVDITAESQDAVEEGLSFFNTLLLIFAGVALFVSSFIIYNTFSITAAQRTHEHALLRAVGASRRQLVTFLLVEAAAVGLVAAVLGLLGGLGMARLLQAGMAAVGIDIPTGGLVVLARTAIWALTVGVGISLVAAIVPSLRASNVPPVAAMRDVAVDRSSLSAARIVWGVSLLAIAAALIVLGLAVEPIVLALGVPLLFVGMFVIGPVLARPVAGWLGAPLKRFRGITGRLAQANATRNPKRTARTASALMVGVALMTGISVLASSVKASIRDIIGEQFTGDFVVTATTFGFGGLPPELADRLNTLPEVADAAGVQLGFARLEGSDLAISVIDPGPANRVFDLEYVAGTGDVSTDGLLLSEDRAGQLDKVVGDTVELTMIDGIARTLTVEGIYHRDDLAGPATISKELYRVSGADEFDFSVFVQTAAGVSQGDAEAAMAEVVDDYATATLRSRSDYIDSQAAQVDIFLNLMYLLLALAVVIAVMGIANALSLSVYERTREIGLLRAVGSARRQVRSTVRWESILTALLGAAQGMVVGILLGYAVIVALRSEGLRVFRLPVVTLVVFVVLSMVAGVIAAIRPARRAAKLDVLRAISSE